jgi:ring-1,2-phenylacetyl-CoA epoxidase subunit PaaE
MKQFHPLKIERIEFETTDSVRIALAVPAEFESDYEFLPGQHLPFEITVGGKKLRRTYSICSGVDERPLQIGIRVQPGGAFSEHAASQLSAGETLDAMPPAGHFHVNLDKGNAKDYLGFAAGSGITPILSMIKSVLENEPYSRFVLFYGNRKQATTMFIEDLYALKNRYPERLQLHFVFSREEQEFPVAAGRLDAGKVRELYSHFCKGLEPAEAFVCGQRTLRRTACSSATGAGRGCESSRSRDRDRHHGRPQEDLRDAPGRRQHRGCGSRQRHRPAVLLQGRRLRNLPLPRS